MPPKTKTKGKGKNQRKDNEPEEDTPKAQGAETEDHVVNTQQGKSPGAVHKRSAPEKTQDELWEEYLKLQKEFQKVQRQKNHFMIETNKAQRLWDNSKRNLEMTKARLREKLRLKQETEKQHQAEIKEHELKLKQLKTAQHNELTELKMAVSNTVSKTHEELVEQEVALQVTKHHLQVDKKEKEFHAGVNIRLLKQKQQDELVGLHMTFEKQLMETEAEYQRKKDFMIKEDKERTTAELSDIEQKMKERTTSILLEHENAWQQFSKSNENILKPKSKVPQRKTLEKELRDLKERTDRMTGRLAAAVENRAHLTKTLQEMQAKLSENKQQLVTERKVMAKSLKKNKKNSAHILEERRNLYLRHHQLELKHEQNQKEMDEMQKRQTEAILNIQQRNNLKSMLAKNKISALTETHEKEQCKLWVALTVGQGDQTALENIKELFQSKDAIIKDLENSLSGDLKDFKCLVKEAEDLGISTEKWLPICDMDTAPVGHMNIDDLIQEMMSLSISKDKSKTAPRSSLSSDV